MREREIESSRRLNRPIRTGTREDSDFSPAGSQLVALPFAVFGALVGESKQRGNVFLER